MADDQISLRQHLAEKHARPGFIERLRAGETEEARDAQARQIHAYDHTNGFTGRSIPHEHEEESMEIEDVTTAIEEAEQIDYMDLAEFQEIGFLQEANRHFFHPLGLALEWRSGVTREGFERLMAAHGYQYGHDAMSNAWAAVCVLGLDKPHLGGVWDYRSDPEGVVFDPEAIDLVKIDNVDAELNNHVDARMKLLGFMVQRP